MIKMIDLGTVTKSGSVKNLSGKQRGLDARKAFEVDVLDNDGDKVIVNVPDYIYSISSSYFLGLFSDSFKKFDDAQKFLAHYEFKASPDILNQVMHSVGRCLMKRPVIDL